MQPLKHPAGMILTESGMEIVLRLIQPLKAFSSIFFTLDGITTLSMSQQLSKALHFIVSIPSGISINPIACVGHFRSSLLSSDILKIFSIL